MYIILSMAELRPNEGRNEVRKRPGGREGWGEGGGGREGEVLRLWDWRGCLNSIRSLPESLCVCVPRVPIPLSLCVCVCVFRFSVCSLPTLSVDSLFEC